MLDVDRAQHVNLLSQQKQHILVALGKAAALDVGVCEFVDQHHLRHAGNDGVHTHLCEQRALVVDLAPRHLLQLCGQLRGGGASVCLHHTDHHVLAPAAPPNAFAQHAERLAHAGRVAEEYLEPPALLFVFAGQQPVFRCLRRRLAHPYNTPMHSRRALTITRWVLAFGALAGIVLVYRRWLHVNPTTVALTLLLLILLLAAEWGLRYAIAVSLVATACYNFFFLPPIGTFTIVDPQNWLALFAFLITAVVASRLSHRARNEARDARARQRELEALFRLSRELLESESPSTLVSSVPSAVASATGARFGLLYLLEGDRLYQAGTDGISAIEIPHLRHMTNALSEPVQDGEETKLPLRSGVRPKGLLLVRGCTLSQASAEAIGSLVSISIDRVQALENLTRGEAAKESERLRTLLIDSITHELRTPLTSIKGAATALLTGSGLNGDSRELLTIIDEESDRLNRLVSEAVETAQLDAQQVQMHFDTVSVRDLIEGARQTCAWVEDAHPVHLNVPEDVQLRADPAILRKVVCNLLENAAKYSQPGSPITLTATARGDEIAISVADHGVGIDPAEQPLIFERFYRARAQEEGTPGTGMGLAISRAIAEAHGGRIEVVSQPGQGSVFTLIVPGFSLALTR